MQSITETMQSINIMKRHSLSLAIAILGLTLIINPVAASAAPQVFEASGAAPADIQTAVDAFRNFLGNPNNIAGPPSATGHREINWDGVPDAFSAPNLLPAKASGTPSQLISRWPVADGG